MDFIGETIEKSWYKFNPRLTAACIAILKEYEEHPPEELPPGCNKCWYLMQMLYKLNQTIPMNLPYYWYTWGVVVDPEALTILTGGIIRFKRDSDCEGCQIEDTCHVEELEKIS